MVSAVQGQECARVRGEQCVRRKDISSLMSAVFSLLSERTKIKGEMQTVHCKTKSCDNRCWPLLDF